MTAAAGDPLRRARAPSDVPAWVRAGDLVFVSAGPEPGADGAVAVPGDPAAQAELALDALERSLEAAGASLDDLVDVVSFHADPLQIEPVLSVAGRRLGAVPPAWTPVVVTGLAAPGAVLALSAIAHAGDGEKRCATPDTIAWWRRLPVSAGCRKGDLVAVAGQYGSDADGNVNTPGDHAGQARNALNRVKEVCSLLGARPDDVVGVLSAHQDPRGIEPAATVYGGELFAGVAPGDLPAWTAVGAPALYGFGMLGQYRALADVGGRERVAARPDGGGSPRHTGSAAVRKDGGSLVAVAAEAGRAAAGDVAAGDPRAQAGAAFEALDRALAAVGCAASDVVSLTSFHKDLRDLAAVRAALLERGGAAGAPTWTAIGMTGSDDPDQLHALHALAVRGGS